MSLVELICFSRFSTTCSRARCMCFMSSMPACRAASTLASNFSRAAAASPSDSPRRCSKRPRSSARLCRKSLTSSSLACRAAWLVDALRVKPWMQLSALFCSSCTCLNVPRTSRNSSSKRFNSSATTSELRLRTFSASSSVSRPSLAAHSETNSSWSFRSPVTCVLSSFRASSKLPILASPCLRDSVAFSRASARASARTSALASAKASLMARRCVARRASMRLSWASWLLLNRNPDSCKAATCASRSPIALFSSAPCLSTASLSSPPFAACAPCARA
mmetsp:Transcript_121041/g.302058  ORF Transcript_121041/g.302058 Transcript_121041/m.302058 type:complete len:278 (+) Transcript_121041:219-1052(+)